MAFRGCFLGKPELFPLRWRRFPGCWLISPPRSARNLSTSSEHSDKIITQFTNQARPFQDFKPHAQSDTLDIFVRLGVLQPSHRVLDCGCGPGIVSRHIAKHVTSVVGLDLTPAMVNLATAETAREQGLSNKCLFLWGDIYSLPFAASTFDASVSRYAFHHLLDPLKAFKEMLRVTRPGGRIVILDASPEPTKQAAYDRFEKLRDSSHASALTQQQLKGLGDSAIATGELLPDPVVTSMELLVDAQELLSTTLLDGEVRNMLLKMLEDDI
eukprot:RCo044955